MFGEGTKPGLRRDGDSAVEQPGYRGGSACVGERRERNEDERREKEEVLGDISDLHRGQRFDNFAKVLSEIYGRNVNYWRMSLTSFSPGRKTKIHPGCKSPQDLTGEQADQKDHFVRRTFFRFVYPFITAGIRGVRDINTEKRIDIVNGETVRSLFDLFGRHHRYERRESISSS